MSKSTKSVGSNAVRHPANFPIGAQVVTGPIAEAPVRTSVALPHGYDAVKCVRYGRGIVIVRFCGIDVGWHPWSDSDNGDGAIRTILKKLRLA